MKTLRVNRKCFMFILVALLMGFGVQGSYAQTINASTPQPSTEANLHGSIVTLTLSGRNYARIFDIGDAVTVSGIDGVTFDDFFDVNRVSDTEVTIELEFNDNIDTNGTLTFTVGAGAISGYNGNALTATIPVTAVTESLVASTEFPLSEVTLQESVVTLTLTGRHFADQWKIRDALTISGIAGITFDWSDIEKVSDTEITIELTFEGNIDTDTTLIFTVVPGAIEDYNGPALTAEIPVSATTEVEITGEADTDAVVSISPSSVASPAVGEQLEVSLNITGGEGVAGYQATVQFDATALRYVSGVNGDFLPAGAFFVQPVVEGNLVKLNAASLAGEISGDGTLATLTFEVIAVKTSTLT